MFPCLLILTGNMDLPFHSSAVYHEVEILLFLFPWLVHGDKPLQNDGLIMQPKGLHNTK